MNAVMSNRYMYTVCDYFNLAKVQQLSFLLIMELVVDPGLLCVATPLNFNCGSDSETSVAE